MSSTKPKTDRLLAPATDEFIWDTSEHTEIHKYVFEPIMSILKEHNCKSLLDIGCGNGSFTSLLAKQGLHTQGIDHSLSGVEMAKQQNENLKFEQYDITSLLGQSYQNQIDADERMSPELKDAICKALESPGDTIAYRVQRRDFFKDTWLKHVQASSYYIRLFKPEQIHYERLVNPVTIPDGPVKEVTGYLNHYPFSKGISHWLDRHNSYSTLEAKQIINNRNNHAKFSIKKSLFSKDFNERRFNQKEIFYRLPGRPFIKFLILYIGKRGFFDGKAGFTYAVLQSFYEHIIVLKTREIAEKKLEWI